ncbi:MAG: dephospho-CoA kinase [Pelagibacteraceae bacterium]|nr:dephospho-CoA kinase [Pelagibacteraceae bacterium]|tara:strand:- start:44887 stop:45483 length:597 start_codon:yes stop_codon:yes gene_type:complete
MTFVVGITGGIGSGKSTLCEHLIKKGYVVHDSDKEVSSLYLKPTHKFIKYLKMIGLEKCFSGEKIIKKKISKYFFSNKEIRKNLEKYIHNELAIKRKKFILQNKRTKTKIIFMDVPLLFEKKLDSSFDEIICVISSKSKRLTRLKKNKKISRFYFNEIIKLQTTDKIRKKRADLIILNNLSKKDLIKKVDKYLKEKTQ